MKLKIITVIMNPGVLNFLKVFILFFSFHATAQAEPIEGHIAVIQILDKITAKVNTLEIKVNDTLVFESLSIKLYACFKNPPEEIPEEFILLKILDQINIEKKTLIYQGWMIKSSPATTPLEHPIYDLWLKECKIDKHS